MTILKQQINTEIIRLAGLLALLFCVLFNTAIVLNKFALYKTNYITAVLELSKDFIIIYAINFITFLGFCIKRPVLYITTAVLFSTGAIASYYLYNFNIVITSENIRAVFENDWRESSEIFSSRLILWIGFCLFVGVYTVQYHNFTETKNYIATIIIAGCLMFTLYSIVAPQYRIMTNYFPYKYLNNTYIYLDNKLKKKPNKLDLSSLGQHYYGSDDLTVVLIIGESARADHFSLNGYERHTNPLLGSTPNTAAFEARACSSMTYISVPCMLTRATAINTDLALQETTFISIFKKLGFTTNWFGTQSILAYLKNYAQPTLYDEVDNVLLPGGNLLYKMNAHDEVLLPYVEATLNKLGKKLIILHTSGSHWNYEQRYPQKFNIFTPGCVNQIIYKTDPATCHHTALINSYDNSIIYTDYFIHAVIRLLQNRNAILIYASDHGQFLGENGRYMHGHTTVDAPEQYNVPMIVWLSEQYKLANDAKYKNIQSHLGTKLTHDHIFHSILDCSSISSIVIDKNLSVCQRKQDTNMYEY